ASLMKEGLAAETVLGLTPEQQTVVRASAGSRRESRNPFKRRLSMPATPTVWAAAGLVAASLLVAVTLAPSFLRSRQASQFAALKTPDMPATVTVLENGREKAPQQPQAGAGGAVTNATEASVHSQAFDSATKDEKEIAENKLQNPPTSGRSFDNLVLLDRQQGQAQQQGQRQAGQQGQQVGAQTDRRRNEAVLSGVPSGVLKAQVEAPSAGPGVGNGIGPGQGGGVGGGKGSGVGPGETAFLPLPAAAAPPPPPAAIANALADRAAKASEAADRFDRTVPSVPRNAANGYDPITDNPFVAVSRE